MSEIVTISVDSYVWKNVMEYLNGLPLPPSRTNFEAANMFKKELESFDRDKIPEPWNKLRPQDSRKAPKYTNVLLCLFELIELSDNRNELLYGAWTDLVCHLSSLHNIVYGFRTVNDTTESNRAGVVNALSGIADTMNKLNRTLKWGLPAMVIQ